MEERARAGEKATCRISRRLLSREISPNKTTASRAAVQSDVELGLGVSSAQTRRVARTPSPVDLASLAQSPKGRASPRVCLLSPACYLPASCSSCCMPCEVSFQIWIARHGCLGRGGREGFRSARAIDPCRDIRFSWLRFCDRISQRIGVFDPGPFNAREVTFISRVDM